MKTTLPHEKVEHSPVVGIFILFLIATGAFALFLNDSMFLLFAIFIAATWILAISRGKGTTSGLSSVGITGEDIQTALPVGIAVGIFSVAIGSIIMAVTNTGSFTDLAAIIIPNTATLASLGTASVIPASLATAVTILTQWFTIAPGEEAGFRVLSVFALESIFQNPIMAFGGATLIWAAMHIPVWMTSGVSSTMYFVVIVWGIIWSAQFIIFRNFFGNVVSHATTNTIVIISSGTGFLSLSTPVIVVLVLITITLIALGVWYAKR